VRESVAAEVRHKGVNMSIDNQTYEIYAIPTLLPCPFCGSQKLELKDIQIPTTSGRKLVRVRCKNCTASGPMEYFDDIKQWNIRA